MTDKGSVVDNRTRCWIHSNILQDTKHVVTEEVEVGWQATSLVSAILQTNMNVQ